MARTNSLDRFLKAHGDGIREQVLAELPATLVSLGAQVELVNEVDRIAVVVSWESASGAQETVALEAIEADLAAAIDEQDFGSDCDMGW